MQKLESSDYDALSDLVGAIRRDCWSYSRRASVKAIEDGLVSALGVNFENTVVHAFYEHATPRQCFDPTFSLCQHYYARNRFRLNDSKLKEKYKQLQDESGVLDLAIEGVARGPALMNVFNCGMTLPRISAETTRRKQAHVFFHYAITVYLYCIIRSVGYGERCAYSRATRFARFAVFVMCSKEMGKEYELFHGRLDLWEYCNFMGLIFNVVMKALPEINNSGFGVTSSFVLVHIENKKMAVTNIYNDDLSGICAPVKRNTPEYNNREHLFVKAINQRAAGIDDLLARQSLSCDFKEELGLDVAMRVAAEQPGHALVKMTTLHYKDGKQGRGTVASSS